MTVYSIFVLLIFNQFHNFKYSSPKSKDRWQVQRKSSYGDGSSSSFIQPGLGTIDTKDQALTGDKMTKLSSSSKASADEARKSDAYSPCPADEASVSDAHSANPSLLEQQMESRLSTIVCASCHQRVEITVENNATEIRTGKMKCLCMLCTIVCMPCILLGAACRCSRNCFSCCDKSTRYQKCPTCNAKIDISLL